MAGRHFGGSSRAAVSGFRKPRTYLSGDFKRDMKELRILGRIRNPQKRTEVDVDETPQFVTYLTRALENLSNILGKGKDLSGLKTPAAVLNELADERKLFEVASFLWLHREENPGRDYKDYAEKTREIVLKLWGLRNMFVHSTSDHAAKVLVVEPKFYRFVEGELYSEAREHALGPGRRTEKIFKLKLFNPHNEAKSSYEFTRKGLIYLVCLALYRHDASEFIQQFPDMQLPPREWEMAKGYVERPDEKTLVSLRKKGGTVKAIIDSFTYFSMRSSRTDIDVENSDYLNFANILLYLNKVPMAAYDYLALEKEANRLAAAGAESTESEANRRFKYVLQERKRDRFMTLALAYIEDFKKLECIRFKRLDITPRPDRKRYMFGPIPAGTKNEFGEELSDANGMDRHYAIANGVAQFEFTPERHYGAVKIARLRGGIGEGELMRLLLVMFDNGIRRQNPNEVIKEYLTAYHRILERMLNATGEGELSLDDPQFRADFKLVSGKGEEAFDKSRFVKEMQPFFSPNITRFFTGEDQQTNGAQLQEMLRRHLEAMRDRANDFLLRMERLTDWRELDDEVRKTAGHPVCRIGELKYPPRSCKISDSQLVRWVFKYINLYLTKDNKYRQLPRGMRHRGVRDFEFQLLHTDIGKFGSNPIGLWKTLEKREDLNGENGPLVALKAREGELFRDEQRRCRGKLDRNGRPLRVGHTLAMLATAAAELYAAECENVIETWCGRLEGEDAELLPYIARFYGVRSGLPLHRDSLVKTILGIDLESWTHAFDYQAGKPYANRRLEDADDLIVSQVPVPNAMAIRCVAQPADGTPFKFNPAFRAFHPYENGKMSLRDYYDVTPLIESVRLHDRTAVKVASDEHARANAVVSPVAGVETRGGAEQAEGSYGKMPPETKCEFSRSEVNKAIQAIQLAERQDKVLLACAKAYWDRYMGVEVMSAAKDKIRNFRFAEAADIGAFFQTGMTDEVGGFKVKMMPNDFARPAYSVITTHIAELATRTKPLADGAYSFYDLWLTLRDLQRKESDVRLQFLPALLKFNVLVGEPPKFDCPKDEIPARLHEYCRKQFAFIKSGPLTREEFDVIMELDKRLRHPTMKGVGLLTIDLAFAEKTLRRLGCLTAK